MELWLNLYLKAQNLTIFLLFVLATNLKERNHLDIQVYIKATGEKSAEMVTDEGAIYVTSNKGYNWKAAIQETVSATLNR